MTSNYIQKHRNLFIQMQPVHLLWVYKDDHGCPNVYLHFSSILDMAIHTSPSLLLSNDDDLYAWLPSFLLNPRHDCTH